VKSEEWFDGYTAEQEWKEWRRQRRGLCSLIISHHRYLGIIFCVYGVGKRWLLHANSCSGQRGTDTRSIGHWICAKEEICGRGGVCFVFNVGREGHGESEMEMWIRRKISIITL
jgi:hypothetical protein